MPKRPKAIGVWSVEHLRTSGYWLRPVIDPFAQTLFSRYCPAGVSSPQPTPPGHYATRTAPESERERQRGREKTKTNREKKKDSERERGGGEAERMKERLREGEREREKTHVKERET